MFISATSWASACPPLLCLHMHISLLHIAIVFEVGYHDPATTLNIMYTPGWGIFFNLAAFLHATTQVPMVFSQLSWQLLFPIAMGLGAIEFHVESRIAFHAALFNGVAVPIFYFRLFLLGSLDESLELVDLELSLLSLTSRRDALLSAYESVASTLACSALLATTLQVCSKHVKRFCRSWPSFLSRALISPSISRLHAILICLRSAYLSTLCSRSSLSLHHASSRCFFCWAHCWLDLPLLFTWALPLYHVSQQLSIHMCASIRLFC